jgi:phage tail sheath gpL-like
MGVSPSAVSRVTGVEASYRNFNAGAAQMLPQRLVIIGVGSDNAVYGGNKREVFSASDVGDMYGYGSPLHLSARQLLPSTGPAAEFPVSIIGLQKATGAIAAAGDVTVTGTASGNGSGRIYIGGIAAEFAFPKASIPSVIAGIIKNAINGILEMPATAGTIEEATVPLTAKWSGALGNKITIEIDGKFPGITFGITGFTDGAGDPDVAPALEKIGTVWETQILNTFDYADTSRLDKYQEFAEGRGGVLEKKPLYIAHGCVDNLETRTAVTDLRVNDASNYLIVSVGSRELPFVVAAKGLINDIVTTANRNPPQNYKGKLTGLHCGADDVQENYSQRNSSITKGSSNNIKTGSVAELNDIVTFYHPQNEGKYPSKRYLVDLVKLQNIVFNVRLIMEADELKGAPLVSDNTVTDNPAAVTPKTIKTMFFNLADSLAKKAIIQEPEFTKKTMSVAIDSENPKRVNVVFPMKLSGNIEVSSTDIYFGFYLGE